jgi:hypothetical protein|eukprot:31194-Pelagococcus_subviridis.AAC.13
MFRKSRGDGASSSSSSSRATRASSSLAASPREATRVVASKKTHRSAPTRARAIAKCAGSDEGTTDRSLDGAFRR